MPAFADVLGIVFRSVVVYISILVGLRLCGKREVGQMTPFDLVLVLLIANAVQNAMVGADTTLVGGLVAAATLLLLNFILTRLVWWNKSVRLLVEGVPTVLISDGGMIQKNIDKEKITEEVLKEALREHGVASVADVKLAVLEVDGTISVIRFDDMTTEARPHHRIRRVAQKF